MSIDNTQLSRSLSARRRHGQAGLVAATLPRADCSHPWGLVPISGRRPEEARPSQAFSQLCCLFFISFLQLLEPQCKLRLLLVLTFLNSEFHP